MVKKVIMCVMAAVLAFTVVNGITFFYERPLAWIDTPNGESGAIRTPHKKLVHGTEGYGINNIDSRGFTNLDFPLNDNYVLMMGASHSQGKEMKADKRYSSLVNKSLSRGKKELATLNISCDGHFLAAIINHFKAAVTKYPNAKCITIQIDNTDYSVRELKEAIIQPREIDMRSAEEIFEMQNKTSKIKNIIKENLPLIAMIKNHLETQKNEKNLLEEESDINKKEYTVALENALSLIRSQYKGPIVFLYHPKVNIEQDSSISLNRSKTIDIFKKCCKDNNIDFIDLGDSFVDYYNKYYELPYGFANTTPGNGHLNEVGHQIMADTIIDYLQEVNLK